MKAVILAGGKGTRLKELTVDIPKPMIPVNNKPLLQYQIELCRQYGLEEVILIVNHLKDTIVDYFGNGEKFGIKISYYLEEKPLGTVGGIKEIEEQLTEDFLVLYGDVMLDMDLERLFAFHRKKNSEATLVVHPNDHPYDSDLVEIDEEKQIIKVLPKPHPKGLWYHNMVNAAVYVFSPSILKELEKGKKADFGKDIFPSLQGKIRMYGYNTPEYIKDMGTLDRLEQVEKDIISGKVARRSLKNKQKAIFLDRDGVINPDKDLIHKTEDMELYPFTAEAIKKINQTDYLAIVVTNQSVVARNLITIKGLGDIHKKMETLLGNQRAKLDDIYYCPHHPDKGYPEENPVYKIDCDCRKPKPGMLLKAAEKYNIDLKTSFMIGDSERDIRAGRAAGCKTIGVMTGKGLKNSSVKPDYFFANLKETVNFIATDSLKKDAEIALNKLHTIPHKPPIIISIGGNTRSGKSTLASYLKMFLNDQKLQASIIHLDDWILPKDQRKKEINVFHNFQSKKLVSDIKRIIKGETVELEAYINHPAQSPRNISYTVDKEDVVIVEGVVALSLEELREISDIKIFLSIEEGLLKEKIELFYQWKGYDNEAIEALWQQRKPNEYDLIARDKQWADLIIQSY